jgi:hypothetical protein
MRKAILSFAMYLRIQTQYQNIQTYCFSTASMVARTLPVLFISFRKFFSFRLHVTDEKQTHFLIKFMLRIVTQIYQHFTYLLTYLFTYLLNYLLTYLLTYLLHGAESFLRSWLVLQLVKKFPAFYGTRKFITVLTSARHLSIQSPQHPPTSRRSILIISSHLRLGLHNGLSPSGLPTKTLSVRY